MPTERFFRLPKEKAEAIQTAAVREFMRVSPEEASINRIVRDAEISRGSFYTYFKDKYELLKWIIGDRIEEHKQSYIRRMEENHGDIWEALDWVFGDSLERTLAEGFMDIIGNLVKSNSFSDFLRSNMDEGNRVCEPKWDYVEKLYQMLDKERYPMSKETFYDLMESHAMVFLMSLKQLFRDKRSQEYVKTYYRRHMRLLQYGACSVAEGQINQERQEEEN